MFGRSAASSYLAAAHHTSIGLRFYEIENSNRTIGKLTYSQTRDSSAPARIMSIGFATGWGRMVEYIKSGTDFNNARLGEASSAEGGLQPTAFCADAEPAVD